jgi:TRAP transporter 4TM/12TM fusion protein
VSHSVSASELEKPTQDINPEMALPENFGEGVTARVLFWIAVAFSTFQIITSFGLPLDRDILPGIDTIAIVTALLVLWAAKIVFDAVRRRPVQESLFAFLALAVTFGLLVRYGGGLPAQVVRNLHVGFLCLLAAGMIASHQAKSPVTHAMWWTLGIAAFAVGVYQWHFYHEILLRAGFLTQTDLVFGVIVIVALFILVWKVMGPALPLVAGIFLAYCLFGYALPAPLDHRGYYFDQIVEQMSFGTEGIFGTPTGVSATYIFLFILFGSFMEQAGVIRFFNELSMALFGGARGGPGKVCVASSALMGTVSGSGVANVVASGQFTIPLMKRYGFSSAFAGGVEATSSMGGQIMPPVMGAVAFIMAETIGVPYFDIMMAAIIPAVLYFGSCYWAVHLEAGKSGLIGLPRSELPSARQELRDNWFLIMPLMALVVMLFGGYTPLFAGAAGLALTVILILGTAIALGLTQPAIRLVFWVGLGLIAAASLWASVVLVLLVVAVLVGISMFFQGGRETLIGCRAALADGARQALPVGLACALVGIVVGTMTLTGIGSIFGTWMISIGENSLFAALVMTMIFSLILGMGIPTIPNYIITSSLAAPILLQLDVPLIVSHMFVFYFGIMADLTPPVALAAFAAAPMAKVSGMKIGVQAVRIAIPGFIVPYMAVYEPALMLQATPGVEGTALWTMGAFVAFKAALAICIWGAATVGYLDAKMGMFERVVLVVLAVFLVFVTPIARTLGEWGSAFTSYAPTEAAWGMNILAIGLALLGLGLHILRARRHPKPAKPAVA